MATVAYFKKVIKGSLSLYLEDVDAMMQPRWFRMDHRSERIAVPINYALSVFVDNNLASMLRRKFFEIENVEEFLEEAKKRGFVAYTEEEEKEVVTPARPDALLISILQGGNEKKIKELFESNDGRRAFDLAIENVGKLPMATIELVESITGMAILEE